MCYQTASTLSHSSEEESSHFICTISSIFRMYEYAHQMLLAITIQDCFYTEWFSTETDPVWAQIALVAQQELQ